MYLRAPTGLIFARIYDIHPAARKFSITTRIFCPG